MKPEPRLTSIWASDSAVELVLLQPFSGGNAGTTLEFEKGPPPEFDAALQALKPEALKFLSLPKAWGEDVVIRSVAVKYKPDGELKGISITFLKPLADSNSPWAPTLPFLPAPSEDGSFGMSGRMVKLLEDLQAQALALAAKPRAQVELFSGPALASEEAAA